MPYNPMMAMTNAQMRNQGMRGALEDFLGFFKAKKAAQDEAEKEGAQGQIGSLSAQQGATGADLGNQVASLQSQARPMTPDGRVALGPMPMGQEKANVSLLNPAVNPQAPTNPAMADTGRKLAEVKAAYANKYGAEPVSAEDFLSKDALAAEKVNQAKATTKSLDLGNQLNTGLMAPRLASAQTEAGKGALDLSTATATQPADIATKNLGPQEGTAKIGLLGAQTNEANAKATKDLAESSAGGNPKLIAVAEHQAKERFDRAGKDTGFNDIKGNWANIQSAIQQANDPKAKDKAPADYTLLDQYLKMVNPGMGVRSANMEMFANSMGLSDKLKSGMLKVQQGGKFDPDVRNAVMDMAKGIYANHEKAYFDKLNSIDEGLAATPGADRDRVFGKTVAARISGAAQPVTGGIDQADIDIINKYKPKAPGASQ